MLIDNLTVGDWCYVCYDAYKPVIVIENPYKIVSISDNEIEWSYGGNCRAVKVKISDQKIFKTLSDAKKYKEQND